MKDKTRENPARIWKVQVHYELHRRVDNFKGTWLYEKVPGLADTIMKCVQEKDEYVEISFLDGPNEDCCREIKIILGLYGYIVEIADDKSMFVVKKL
jgi:hypothetical protein